MLVVCDVHLNDQREHKTLFPEQLFPKGGTQFRKVLPVRSLTCTVEFLESSMHKLRKPRHSRACRHDSRPAAKLPRSWEAAVRTRWHQGIQHCAQQWI